VHDVSQWLNLRYLGEPLRGAEGLLETVSFKKATESMSKGRVVSATWERVPDGRSCNTKTMEGKVVQNKNFNRLVFAEHRQRVRVWKLRREWR